VKTAEGTRPVDEVKAENPVATPPGEIGMAPDHLSGRI
jgi:hypothetical protein